MELLLRGSEELAMDYDVFGQYAQKGTENGKPKYLGPKAEGSHPSIAFCIAGDGKPTWWIYDACGGECFYAEADSATPPENGWRKLYGTEDLDVTLERVGSASPRATGTSRARSRSRGRRASKKHACPW